MAAEPLPARPPWRRGEAPTVDERNFYEKYLLMQIKVRDLKHEALTHHVREHCQ